MMTPDEQHAENIAVLHFKQMAQRKYPTLVFEAFDAGRSFELAAVHCRLADDDRVFAVTRAAVVADEARAFEHLRAWFEGILSARQFA